MDKFTKVERIALTSGENSIYFTKITDKRFKVNRISINLSVKLDKNTVTEYAVLSALLPKSNSDFPEYKDLSIKLAELYGASLFGDIRKVGDTQIVNLSVSGIDNRFALENEDILSELTNLLANCLVNPALENGVFTDKNVKLALSNHLDVLESELNDKQTYAMNKAQEILFENEPASLNKYGTIKQIKQINSQSLYNSYKNLLSNAEIEVICVGCNDFEETGKILAHVFKDLDRKSVTKLQNKKSPQKRKVCELSEKMPVSQCKMVLGFKVLSDDLPALTLLQRIYGGTATSKLFMNVREKMSLAYYCSSRIDEIKGAMYVNSGVERENIEKAKEEVLNQLSEIINGNITDDEINHAILDIKNSTSSVYDTTSGLEIWYLSRIFRGDLLSPNEYADIYTNSTRERIQQAASKIVLDSIYTLISDGSTETLGE